MASNPGFGDHEPETTDPKMDWAIRDEMSGWINSVRLTKGEPIIEQSTVPEHAYVLRNGLLGLYRRLSPTKSILVGTVRAGESVGLNQVMYGTEFPTDLIPIKESIGLRGDRDDIIRLKEKHPDALSDALLKETHLFTGMYDRVEKIKSEDVEQRIARMLLELSDQIGRGGSDGVRIQTRLSRKDLSQMVGCTHESASRSMSGMETDGIIETNHKYITINNPNRLRSFLNEP